jgi:hypothetical protein
MKGFARSLYKLDFKSGFNLVLWELHMRKKFLWFVVAMFGAPCLLNAQFDFDLFGKDFQVHSFASQGFMYSNQNNYLTTNTSQGSFAFTDMAANVSTQLTDKLRVGAQVYVMNLGHLGNWQPELDWAFVDYRFKSWFGVRGGKVKTTLGLYNDTQDMEFLHTWALLPQSNYPTDLRGNTIAHVGGDIYGNISMNRLGSLDYVMYGGQRPSDLNGGIDRGLAGSGLKLNSYGGTVKGADLRWTTPIKGFMAGVSFISLDVTEDATRLSNLKPYTLSTLEDNTPVYYFEYSIGKLRLDGEYRREVASAYKTGLKTGGNGTQDFDIRSEFVSAAYRVNKWMEVGTYHSRYYPNYSAPYRGLPANHLFDQTVTASFDLRSYLDLKIEGHFMNGETGPNSYHGFYTLDNPLGLKPTTNMLVIRLGYHM